MKKLFYRALYRLLWCLDCVKVGCYMLFAWSPWGRAYICTALKGYLESDWFKERSGLFVKRRALEMYFDHGESWFFKRKITRREKLGIMLAPFSYIKRAQKAVDENGLMDYI